MSHGRKFIFQVPRGHVWLEGDNALNSTDSRSFGAIPLGLIQSRAILRLWPIAELGFLESHEKLELIR